MEAKRLGIGLQDMQRMFRNDSSIPRTAFKRRLVEMGFSLADFPDDDFVVLDENNDGSISSQEFIQFFKEGVEMNDPTNEPPPPTPAPDDLVFQPIDLAGELTVIVNGAKGLRRGAAWFAPEKVLEGGENDAAKVEKSVVTGRKKFNYDVEAAVLSHEEPLLTANLSRPKKQELPPLPAPSNPSQSRDKSKPPQLRPATPYSHMPGGEFIPPPNTFEMERGMMTPRSQFGDDEGLQPVSQSAKDAGMKLHQDPTLRDVEARRSSTFLQMMRNKAKEEKGSEVCMKGENGLLISKHGLKPGRTDKQSGLVEVLEYLGMSNSDALAYSSANDLTTLKTGIISPRGANSSSEKASARDPDTLIKGGRYRGRPEDIWDVFIDRVAVICSCRSNTSIAMSKTLNKNSIKMSFFDNLIPPPSPIPTPKTAKHGMSQSRRSSAPISRGGLNSISGRQTSGGTATASMTSKYKGVSAQKINDTLKDESSDTSYVEVFRRIVPIPLCNFSKV